MNYYINPIVVVFSENEAEAIRLIEEGTGVSIPDESGRLPMYWAAKRGKQNEFVIFPRFFLSNFINRIETHFPGLEKVVRLLIEKGYKDQIHHRSNDDSLEMKVPLIAAVLSGKFKK